MQILRDGSFTNDDRLDRLVGLEEANRAWPVRPLLAGGKHELDANDRVIKTKHWPIDMHYDQGQEGRCVEYAICHELRAEPVQVTKQKVGRILNTKAIYHQAQREDQWPGGSYEGAEPHYEGTSVSAAAKVARDMGLYSEFRWAFTLEDALLALSRMGPLVVGFNWYDACFTPDSKGVIKVEGALGGGHALCVRGLTARFEKDAPKHIEYLDQDTSFVTYRQSWGRDHGLDGDVKMSVRDFDRLRREDGEVMIPVYRLKG